MDALSSVKLVTIEPELLTISPSTFPDIKLQSIDKLEISENNKSKETPRLRPNVDSSTVNFELPKELKENIDSL